MSDRVLIVEDDPDIATLISVNLEELGIHVDHFLDGKQGCQAALSSAYELVILDIMLPNMNGLDICRTLREQKPEQAILMLTAKNSETDKVLGLELGADDYMHKPFSIRELQARVRAQIRRAHLLTQVDKASVMPVQIYTSGALSINQKTRQLTRDGTLLELTATEFDLLLHLMENPNQVFSRSQLLEAVWGYQYAGYEHTVNSHINRLRAKIETNVAHPEYVQTVWGVGYKFNTEHELVE